MWVKKQQLEPYMEQQTGSKLGKGNKGMTEDKMVEWYHLLNGHEFEQTPGHGTAQESLVFCSPWGRKTSDMTE